MQGFGPYQNLPISAQSLATARLNQSTFSTQIDPGGESTVRIYSAPIFENNSLVGIVQVGQSLANVQDTLTRLLTAILLGAPLLVIATGLGGYYLAGRALFPIDQITHTAERISAEDLSTRLGLPRTNDEVGRLAATFDHMIGRLDEAFRRERQFTADASHELRTPLSAMLAIIGVIREEPRSQEDYEKALDDIGEEAERLRTLTEELLNLARRRHSKSTGF